jgi:phosphoribosylanthranilate isomerase
MTHPDDAQYAAQCGADYIGIILTKRSKRYVTPTVAQAIAQQAKINGAEPIAVFTEESADEILDICQKACINSVQLHGETSRQAADKLLKIFKVFYAIPVEHNGSYSFSFTIPEGVTPLFDTLKGGTGNPYDWVAFKKVQPKQPWILAGGLNQHNINSAIQLLQPYCVDVSSGVEYPHELRKNPELVKAFIQAAKNKEFV